MKPMALTMGLAGVGVFAFGNYPLACGFLVLGIWFALEWLTGTRNAEPSNSERGTRNAESSNAERGTRNSEGPTR